MSEYSNFFFLPLTNQIHSRNSRMHTCSDTRHTRRWRNSKPWAHASVRPWRALARRRPGTYRSRRSQSSQSLREFTASPTVWCSWTNWGRLPCICVRISATITRPSESHLCALSSLDDAPAWTVKRRGQDTPSSSDRRCFASPPGRASASTLIVRVASSRWLSARLAWWVEM